LKKYLQEATLNFNSRRPLPHFNPLFSQHGFTTGVTPENYGDIRLESCLAKKHARLLVTIRQLRLQIGVLPTSGPTSGRSCGCLL
jgi:hypothetical protein